MQTRLGLFCDKVVEAGLLAVVTAVPLFFNVYSERTFEPDKAALLRSLVLLMAVAWLIQAIESWGGLRRVSGLRSQVSGSAAQDLRLVTRDSRPVACDLRLATRDLSLFALLLAAVYCLSTLLSVAPNFSLWGSYQRAQGLYTLLSYVGLFLLALRTLRHWGQINRLVTAILLVSVPLTVYALLQQFGLDPQGWGGPQAGRVFSTLGNPIFLGGYLITVIPLTVARILSATRNPVSSEKPGFWPNIVPIGVYGALLLLQLASLFFAQSRGPLVGLLGGAFLMFLLLAAVRRQRRLVLGTLLTVVALGGLLVLLNALAILPQGFGDTSYLGRFGQLLDPQSLTAQQRIWTWQGTVDLIASDPARALVGYGPDTLILTFGRHFPPELVSLPGEITITFDRAHNAILDTVATTGLLGLVVYLSFVSAVIYHGLVGLGLVRGSVQRRAFIAALGIGTLLGTLSSPLLSGSWRLAGLSLSAGWLLGLATYLVGHTLMARQPREAQNGGSIWLIALLTAVVAHFIEMQFGIAVVPTTVHFWLFAAVIVLLGQEVQQESTEGGERGSPVRSNDFSRFLPASASNRRPKSSLRALFREALREGWWAWMGWDPIRAPESLLIGLLLATLGFGLITDPTHLRGQGVLLVGLLAMISLICHGLLGDRPSPPPPVPPAPVPPNFGGPGGRGPRGQRARTASGTKIAPHSIVGNAALSLSWGLLFLIPHVLGMALRDDGTGSLMVYYAYVLLTVVAVASALSLGQPLPRQGWRRRAVPLYAGLALAVAWLVIVSNLNVVRADVHYKQAIAYGEAGQWDESIRHFEGATHLAPQQDFYTLLLAGAYVQKAWAAATVGEREAWMEKAEASLMRGWGRNPLYPDHSTKLGLLHRLWGEMSTDPAVKQQKLEQAEKYYAEAAKLSPHSIPVLNGWAMAYMALGNYGQAEAVLRRALALRPSVVETNLLLGDTYLAQERVDEAATAYGKAIALDSRTALSYKQNSVQASPSDPARRLQLALLYRELGQAEPALQEAQTAQRLAGGELPGLAEVLASLEDQSSLTP